MKTTNVFDECRYAECHYASCRGAHSSVAYVRVGRLPVCTPLITIWNKNG
jgi:hypothetical protein